MYPCPNPLLVIKLLQMTTSHGFHFQTNKQTDRVTAPTKKTVSWSWRQWWIREYQVSNVTRLSAPPLYRIMLTRYWCPSFPTHSFSLSLSHTVFFIYTFTHISQSCHRRFYSLFVQFSLLYVNLKAYKICAFNQRKL